MPECRLPANCVEKLEKLSWRDFQLNSIIPKIGIEFQACRIVPPSVMRTLLTYDPHIYK